MKFIKLNATIDYMQGDSHATEIKDVYINPNNINFVSETNGKADVYFSGGGDSSRYRLRLQIGLDDFLSMIK